MEGKEIDAEELKRGIAADYDRLAKGANCQGPAGSVPGHGLMSHQKARANWMRQEYLLHAN